MSGKLIPGTKVIIVGGRYDGETGRISQTNADCTRCTVVVRNSMGREIGTLHSMNWSMMRKA